MHTVIIRERYVDTRQSMCIKIHRESEISTKR
jgi:hypothetical protein